MWLKGSTVVHRSEGWLFNPSPLLPTLSVLLSCRLSLMLHHQCVNVFEWIKLLFQIRKNLIIPERKNF